MAVRTDLFRIVHQDLTAWIVMDCQPVFHEHPLSVSHQALIQCLVENLMDYHPVSSNIAYWKIAELEFDDIPLRV